MKFLAILVLFALVGQITPAPRPSHSPKVVYRMEDESGEASDEVEEDERQGDDTSSEEVPQWSFREASDSDNGWQQHQQNQIQPAAVSFQGQGQFQPSPVRRFRDDDSEEEEDDEDDEDDFNDDVVHSDIQYSSGPQSSGQSTSTGGFRSILFGGRGRAGQVMVHRPMTTAYPVSSYNRMQIPNRVQVMSNGIYVRTSSYGGNNRRVAMSVPMTYRPASQRPVYPVRYVSPSMVNRRQYQKPVMMSRPMVYNRNQVPMRHSSYVPNSYTVRTRPSMMYTRPMQQYYYAGGATRRNRRYEQFW